MIRWIRRDGAAVWAELRNSYVYADVPVPVAVEGIARDFTSIVEMETALDRERSRLAITLNSIGNAVIATNTDARVTLINPVAQSLTGWQREEALGQPLKAVMNMANDSTGLFENPVAKVLATGHTVGLANHTTLISKDGHRFAIADSAAPIVDSEGTTLGVIMVFRDVTERSHAEQVLRRREQEFRAVVEDSPDLILSCDRSRRYVYANPAVFVQLGIDHRSIISQSDEDLDLFPGSADHWYTILDSVFALGVEQEYATRMDSVDGSRWYLFRLVPESSEEGIV